MEKRRHQRMAVANLHVDISDGQGFFSGTVEDFSRFGMKLDNVPKRLDEKAGNLALVVSGEGKHFKMKARPRWARRKSFSKKVGLEIVNAPWGWAEFVMQFEPGPDDILAEIHL